MKQEQAQTVRSKEYNASCCRLYLKQPPSSIRKSKLREINMIERRDKERHLARFLHSGSQDEQVIWTGSYKNYFIQ